MPGRSNRYLEALRQIPRGETRSFMELAAMAGRPGAARAAGRAVRGCSVDSRLPWHRVVAVGARRLECRRVRVHRLHAAGERRIARALPALARSDARCRMTGRPPAKR